MTNRANEVIVTHEAEVTTRTVAKGMSWGAIIAGALVALMTTLLLTLLFAGIGLRASTPRATRHPCKAWEPVALSPSSSPTCSRCFLAAGSPDALPACHAGADSFLHGILTWTVLTLLTIFLVSSAVGRLVGGATSLLGNTLSTATQGAAAAAPDSANALSQLPGVDALQGQVDQFLEQAGVQNPEQAGQELVGW